MWTWKHSLSLVVFYMTIASVFIDFKHFIGPKNPKNKTFILDCFDPSGDGSVNCYFNEKYEEKSYFNVTVIKPSGNYSAKMIQSMTSVGFHKYNMPEFMPGNIGNLFPFIEELQITHSSLKHLNRPAFKSMLKLIILNLDQNEIETIPSHTFYDLHSLVFLKLNGNKLKELAPPLVNRLHKLHTFSAVNNKITRIDANFFRFNIKIKWVYLYGNKIDNLLINFRNLKHLKAVDLRKNPGNCSLLYNKNLRSNFTVENFQRNVTRFCNGGMEVKRI